MGNAAVAADTAALPERQVRAAFNSDHLTVYQAFRPDIAEAAVAAGTLVAPFSLDRMTWIKPSFTWMMYRSGWATKPGQERVLAVRIARSAFDRALASSCLSQNPWSANRPSAAAARPRRPGCGGDRPPHVAHTGRHPPGQPVALGGPPGGRRG